MPLLQFTQLRGQVHWVLDKGGAEYLGEGVFISVLIYIVICKGRTLHLGSGSFLSVLIYILLCKEANLYLGQVLDIFQYSLQPYTVYSTHSKAHACTFSEAAK